MANRYSQNLPEVVPDSSPQVLTYAEAYGRRGLDEGEQKYTVIYDLNTPKIATSVPAVGDCATPTTPAPACKAAPAGAAGASGNISPDAEDFGKSEKAFARDGERKILGLKRRTFFIIIVVALVTAAAVGGGVGGFHAGKQKASGGDVIDVAEGASPPLTTGELSASHPSSAAGSSERDPTEEGPSDEDSESHTSGSSTAGSSSAKPRPTSSRGSPSPSPTSPKTGGGENNDGDDDEDDDEKEDDEDEDDDRDDRPKPGFKFRGWKDANFKGSATDIVVTTGFLDLPFDVTSYKWHPEGTDCCVTMCQGKKENVGWRCTNFERKKASASFGRIFIGCGAEASQESSRCS